jgi:acetyl-CoA C-acetyltransferase
MLKIVVAGGMESMTNAPYLLPQARSGYRMGNGAVVDAMIQDGLWEAYKGFHMGVGAEMIAAKYGITREEQDAFAPSRIDAQPRPQRPGSSASEIVPVEIPAAKKGAPARIFDTDESIRPETTVGNSRAPQAGVSGRRHGHRRQLSRRKRRRGGAWSPAKERAQALGLKPLAVIRAQSTSGVEPEWFGLAPIEPCARCRPRRLALADVDLFELNEAFSVQALAVIRDLGLDPAKVNVHGGSVAIGHPIGASGARVLVTLLYAMQRHGKRRALRPYAWAAAMPWRWP